MSDNSQEFAYFQLQRWIWGFERDYAEYMEFSDPMEMPPINLVGPPLEKWINERIWGRQHAQYHLVNTIASVARNIALLAPRFPPVADAWVKVTVLPGEAKRLRGLLEHAEEYQHPEGRPRFKEDWRRRDVPMPNVSVTADSTIVTEEGTFFGGTLHLETVAKEIAALKAALLSVPEP